MATKLIRRQLKKKVGDKSKTRFSENQKFEAVVTYMVLGNMAAVSEALGIPHDRLRQWKCQAWWKETEAKVREQKRVEVSGKLSKIVDRAAKIVEDRLENGNWRIAKSGELIRIPVDAKVAAEIMTKSIDKQVLLDKIQETPQIKEEAVLDRLASIAQKLVEAGKKTRPNVIDVTPTHVSE